VNRTRWRIVAFPVLNGLHPTTGVQHELEDPWVNSDGVFGHHRCSYLIPLHLELESRLEHLSILCPNRLGQPAHPPPVSVVSKQPASPATREPQAHTFSPPRISAGTTRSRGVWLRGREHPSRAQESVWPTTGSLLATSRLCTLGRARRNWSRHSIFMHVQTHDFDVLVRKTTSPNMGRLRGEAQPAHLHLTE
jgi:hypothetical protein